MFLSWWLSVWKRTQCESNQNKTRHHRLPRRFHPALAVEHLEDRLVPVAGKASIFLNLGTPTAPVKTITATPGSTVPVFIDFDTISAGTNGGLGSGSYYLLYDPSVLSVSETQASLGSDIKLGSVLSGRSANYNLNVAGGHVPGVVGVGLNHSGATFVTGSVTGHLIEIDFHVVASTTAVGSSALLDLQAFYTDPTGTLRQTLQADRSLIRYTLSPVPTSYAGVNSGGDLPPLSTLTQVGASTPSTFNPPDTDTSDVSIQIVNSSTKLPPTVQPDTYSMAPNDSNFASTMAVAGAANGVLANDTPTSNGPMIAALAGTGVTATTVPASTSLIAGASESGGVITFTTQSANNLMIGQAVTITGVATSGYNGTYEVANLLSNTQFNVFATTLGLTPDTSLTGSTTAAATTIYEQATANGTVWLNSADGTFAYTPNANFSGSDSFTYNAIDAASGTASAPETVTIYVGGDLYLPQDINKDTDNNPINVGSQVVVPIYILDPNPSNSGGLIDATIGINYDPMVFDPTTVTVSAGNLPSGTSPPWSFTVNPTNPGEIIIVSSATGGAPPLTSTTPGTIAFVTFTVIGIPANANGTSIINLSGSSPQVTELVVNNYGAIADLPFVSPPTNNFDFNGTPGPLDGVVHFARPKSTSTNVSAGVDGSTVSDVNYGTPVTLTAVVTDTSAGIPPAPGSVSFFDGAVNLGTSTSPTTQLGNETIFSLVTTARQLQVISANGGMHTVTAVYSPGAGFSTSSGTLIGGLSVRPAQLIITAVATTKTYDSTTSTAAKPTVSGLVGSDSVTGLAEAYSDPNSGSSKTLTVSGYLVNDGNGGSNYLVTVQANQQGEIDQASLTITAVANTKTYDATTSAAAKPTVSGLVGSDSVTGLAEAYSDPNSGSSKTLTVSGYLVNDGNGGSNYLVTVQANQQGEIDQASLTITAVANTKTYDATTSAAAKPTVSGLVGSDTVTGLTEAYSDPNAGSNKTLTVSGYLVNDGNGGSNYVVTVQPNQLGEIDQASLTITAVANTKTYDATTSAAAKPTVSGLVGSDTVTGLAEAYSDPNAGSNKTLTVSGYLVHDGNGGSNYVVTVQPNQQGEIDQASLTITAVANTKTYDATTSAAAKPTVSGLVASDTVTGLAEAYSDRNAGLNKTLTVSGYLVNDGNGGSNYVVTVQPNQLGEIDQASLTITAVANTKTYDATTSAAAKPTVSGLVASDTVTGLAEAYSDPNAGSNKTLTVSGYLVNDGNGGSNYVVTVQPNQLGEIDQASLTITAVANTKTYDATTSAAAVPTVSGLVGDDTVTGLAEVYNNANAGTGKMLSVSAYTVSNPSNYSVSTVSSTTGVITTTPLTITANNQTMAYGAAVPPLTATYSGFVGGDTLTSLATPVILNTTATSSSAPGIYPITASGATDPNYSITFVSGTLTVTGLPQIPTGTAYVLNPTLDGALTISGNAAINLPGALVVDSNSASAILASGNAKITATGGVLVVGGVSKSGNASVTKTGTPGTTSDPLASLTAPTPPSYAGTAIAESLSGNSTATISQGRYSQINVSGNAKLTLNPGVYVIGAGGVNISGNATVTGSGVTYIIEGGGFAISGNAGISGTNVLIINGGSNYPNSAISGETYGGITLSGNGSFSLNAATTGADAGILVYQARDNTRALSISGNAMAGITGTIYAANALLTISGNASLQNPLVVGTLNLGGNVSLTQLAQGSEGASDAGRSADSLLAGNLEFYISDASKVFTLDDRARINDAVSGLDALLVPYNVSITQVSDPSLANLIVDTGSTSASGSTADGVLGCYNGGVGEITILQGWNWYAGADPTKIGQNQYDFQTTIIHEFGHALGLGHSTAPDSPMFGSLAPGQAHRVMTVADLNIPDPPGGADPLMVANRGLLVNGNIQIPPINSQATVVSANNATFGLQFSVPLCQQTVAMALLRESANEGNSRPQAHKTRYSDLSHRSLFLARRLTSGKKVWIA